MSGVLEDKDRRLSGRTSPDGDDPVPPDLPVRPPVPPVVRGAVIVSVVGFVVVGVGWPLVGVGVFAPTDVLALFSPYGDGVLAGLAPQNRFLQDVADGVIPQTALFVDLLREGAGGAWNPYTIAGVPLGALPNNALFNPVSLPFYLMPAWLAPAWVKVLETVVAVGGTFLFARRLGLGRPAAVVGGLVFATSAFMIAWTGWPQSRTAAFIPVLLWAVERLVQRRRPTDAVLVCLATAAMLLGGFPAVTGYALAAAGAYLVLRLVAEYRGQWRRITALAGAGAAAVGAAAGLAAFQLLPFGYFLSRSYVWGREQAPTDHIPFQALITAVAPWALGTTYPGGEPHWARGTQLVEALSYVGAAALLLALVALAAARPARALLPRGVWAYLVSATGVVVLLGYLGGPPLALAQRLPVLFSDNYVGRIRSVLGVLVAVLAAVGFELVLRRRERATPRRPGVWGAAVWTAAAAGLVLVWLTARGLTGDDPSRTANFDRQVLTGLVFLAVAGLCVALAWWSGRGRTARVARTAALVGIPVLVAAQALLFVRPYWAHAERDTFYPRTDVHRYLADHLGHDRYASPPNTLTYGESSIHRLRSLNGHAFSDRRLGELLEAMPGQQYFDPPSLPSTAPSPEVVTSPVLDRLAVRYFVSSARSPVLGTPHVPDTAGPARTLRPGEPVTAPVQQRGPLRAVVARVSGPVREQVRLDVSVRDAAGTELADGTRLLPPTDVPYTLHIPVAGEDIPAATPLTATLTVHGAPLRLAGAPALTTVAPADDGLRLVLADPAVVYQRTNALPRLRWAGTAVVEPNPDRRLAALAAGEVPTDAVLLDAPTGESSGAGARLRVVEDGAKSIEVAVDAAGAGYLVVADALQNGWRAEVDGQPADLLRADHAVVAVAVPPGRHTVRLTYAAPYGGAGTWLSAGTAVSLGALLATDRWLRRRRHTSPTDRVEG
ncbi:YfhO family protein [Actinophytocola xanthii]|uniref:YfhO family protein n=1 Tax=Actinophytocola xanthii TaxID=1912961 RepID=A0A1Q8CRA3_9PSEU|nr:YfhO family protein [Actinophytocola xanthii]OLF16888.1 hypothetical protein BU204_14390 [Actinophytocola xanthii]